MKKLTIIFAIAAVASFLAACDDDSSSSASGNDALGGDSFFAVETLDDLPACTDSREGDSVLVTSLNAIYLCNDGKWENLDIDDLQESSSSAVSSSSDSLEQLPSSSSVVKDVSSSSVKASSSSSAMMSSSNENVSSSSAIASSSSENVSSSSLEVSYGTFSDSRDGQFYKTVTIGEQVWMAENLNYDYNTGTAESYCYNDAPDSCAKYGRLYTWAAAMDSAGVFSDGGKGCGYGKTCGASGPVRGACPEGWHLPSKAEWDTLFKTVGGTSVAGLKLKSKSGWFNEGEGTDEYGFSVLPAGSHYDNGDYSSAGKYAYFWSSTWSSYYAYRWYFDCYNEFVHSSSIYKYYGYSVRCLRDSK
ncbi:fibrobacter succinogenes major paralogous domain-containing protein [uncultured Fibrobacter sp.]|uniref:fibrobacter succinogenes major paralogous domain-containing protein n=1 Tax=uncultured Fibrobacter sp. TaxID=261512 RepID=UPI0028045211|nr:fibrobacter succinogenes major paralogous domain-containing protein [uncultured Fibrobacter sp.]